MMIDKILRRFATAVVFAAAACAPALERDAARLSRDALDRGRMISAPVPPRVAARTPDALEAAAAAAGAISPESLAGRRGARAIEVAEIPFLRAAPDGAAFLSGSAHRALARGAPPHMCPATGAAIGAATAADAARDALDDCFAALRRRGAAASCGCQVIALDAMLLDRRDAFAHAPGVSAHLVGPASRPRALVAEALPPEGDAARALLRDASGVFGQLTLTDETAEMRLVAAPETQWSGMREMFGYRRGRIAERIRFTAPDGRRATLLIGVERRDAESQ